MSGLEAGEGSRQFNFGDEPPLDGDRLEVEVAAGIADKRELLEALDKGLTFPDYFGWNWDAFDECLRDLGWLEPRQIVIRHQAVPFEAASPELATYVAILGDAVERWQTRRAHELVVVFPADARAVITSA